MEVGETKDQDLYNKPSAAVHPGALAVGTLTQYNTIQPLSLECAVGADDSCFKNSCLNSQREIRLVSVIFLSHSRQMVTQKLAVCHSRLLPHTSQFITLYKFFFSSQYLGTSPSRCRFGI